jgi:hypothetical protein
MTIIQRDSAMEKGCDEEKLVRFIPVNETTTVPLTDTISREQDYLYLSINDCRSQGYDNGADMVGVHSCVKI